MTSTDFFQDTQEITARLGILEHQHKTMLDSQAAMISEIRGLRDDLRNHSVDIARELGRVYRAVAPNGD